MPSSPPYNAARSGNVLSGTGGAYPNGNPALPFNLPGSRHTDSAIPLHRNKPVQHDYRSEGPAPGKLGFRWTYGSNIAAKNRDPRVQVVQYNEDTFVLRQNVCVHWEAPFTYLLFGNDAALLIDAGATANPEHYPLRETVDAIVARWAQARGRSRVPLTVALTSGEDLAQNQGLVQFAGRNDTTIVPKPLEVMKKFYRLASGWPAGVGKIDLGDRVIEVLPTPGTHKDGVSFYDPYCDLLFTGDFLYPGKIQIGNDRDFVASLERVKTFVASRPVRWILGGHIEMMFVPGRYYPRFATYKPYERILELESTIIDEVLHHAREIQGKEMMLIRGDFALYNGVSPDQRTTAWPSDLPAINPPRPF
ncbi:MBL fold metallo-hydrolase [Novosphingobium sp. JCM 18896]|uniref:MBL fold metallo-hydrolase n=1 Tax=Novosphingobium sp. JCM 18896 TaxID=2989731 RepID=UPI002222D11C|nr:MBL fold metallo-hydrolase [Novosphingobium sp. JCM 18896]MCW1427791.1 MBL fold metallo-hydrolase [Novosphingobium sp. JCM 18896]